MHDTCDDFYIQCIQVVSCRILPKPQFNSNVACLG